MISHVNGIHTFDNHVITTDVIVVNRVSIDITAGCNSEYIYSCIQRWISDGSIKLKFNVTEQEAFMLALMD